MKSNREINRNFIKELQDWYIEQCNDDWEHSYGVRIDTLDNPGWDISIDLNDTRWSDIEISLNRFDDSDLNWYQYQVAGGKYLACGGPFLLEKLIQIFFDEVVSARP
ncbi:rhodanese-related sulfurtransferase [Lysobacteraceae bacterium NML95-0200]|nr:rhodanese-related sulfurtransferase [Xanthomonadaceae bacterium NML95-0200]